MGFLYLIFSIRCYIARNFQHHHRAYPGPNHSISTKCRSDLDLLKTLASLQKLSGQRCSGRNFQGRRCCTPDAPCDEGEGDCDGPGDGGNNDGHRGCRGDLVCGSNNCKKFGHYYHEKDDCCEKPWSDRIFDEGRLWKSFKKCVHVLDIPYYASINIDRGYHVALFNSPKI